MGTYTVNYEITASGVISAISGTATLTVSASGAATATGTIPVLGDFSATGTANLSRGTVTLKLSLPNTDVNGDSLIGDLDSSSSSAPLRGTGQVKDTGANADGPATGATTGTFTTVKTS